MLLIYLAARASCWVASTLPMTMFFSPANTSASLSYLGARDYVEVKISVTANDIHEYRHDKIIKQGKILATKTTTKTSSKTTREREN